MPDEEPTAEPLEPLSQAELIRRGFVVRDDVLGDPPPYDEGEAARLLREGDPRSLEPDPGC